MKKILLLILIFCSSVCADDFSEYFSPVVWESTVDYNDETPYYIEANIYQEHIVYFPKELKELYKMVFDNSSPQAYKSFVGCDSFSDQFDLTTNLCNMTTLGMGVINWIRFKGLNLIIQDITVSNIGNIYAGIFKDSLEIIYKNEGVEVENQMDSIIYAKPFMPIIIYLDDMKVRLAPIKASNMDKFKAVRSVVANKNEEVFLSGFHGVAKVSEYYNISWEHYFNENMLIYSSKIDSVGNLILTGYFNDDLISLKTNKIILSSVSKEDGFDIFNIALNKNGEIVSANKIEAVRWNNKAENNVLRIDITEVGEYAGAFSVLGNFTSDSITVGKKTLYRQSKESGYFARFNNDGGVEMLYQTNGTLWDYEGEHEYSYMGYYEGSHNHQVKYAIDSNLVFLTSVNDSLMLNGKKIVETNSLVHLQISTKEPSQNTKDVAVVTDETDLGRIYPNPFNPTTTVNFSMQTAEKVNLSVYNIKGQKIQTLYNKLAKAGNTSVSFNGSKFASGVYFVKMSTASGVVRSKKMVLLK